MPLHAARSAPCDTSSVDPRIDELLRGALAVGVAIVLLLPAARGVHPMIGWLPMWLVAMPAVAWWALHRFRLPARGETAPAPVALHSATRRTTGVQARRRVRAPRGGRLPHAA